MKAVLLFLVFCFALASAEVYFAEEFGAGWQDRWVISQNKVSEGTAGEFRVSAGDFFADEEKDAGLQTTQDAKFYQISAEIKEFSNRDKPLVLQYTVKHQQNIDCGGGYIKLLPAGLDQENFSGDSAYNIMFGPDVCGSSRRTHFILNYKGKNHLIKKDIRTETDKFTHLYTLIINPDNTFKVLIDNKEVRSGSIADEFDVLPPREIKDPETSKPEDWVDEKEIPDPEAVKPADWDDQPAEIPDPDATKPEDWDDELDGEWETPMIPNPNYGGEWKHPMIKNPLYKGEWVHPMIPNPEFQEDNTIYAFDSHKYVGIEIWQVKSGTIFDNVLVTDDLAVAQEWAQRTLDMQPKEKEALKAQTPAPAENQEDDEDEDAEDFDLGDLAGQMEGMEGLENINMDQLQGEIVPGSDLEDEDHDEL